MCYIDIEITDKNGIVRPDAENELTCAVAGCELLGIYGANPVNYDNFTSNKCHAFKGRALAVVRAKKDGIARVTVCSDGLAGATYIVNVKSE